MASSASRIGHWRCLVRAGADSLTYPAAEWESLPQHALDGAEQGARITRPVAPRPLAPMIHTVGSRRFRTRMVEGPSVMDGLPSASSAAGK